MKFNDWFEKSKNGVEDLSSSIQHDTIDDEPTVEITDESKKFIDSVTGKEYKTAAALKSAITRRINRERK